MHLPIVITLRRRVVSLLSAFVFSVVATSAAVTVTDENDVVYDIIEGTTDVVVSVNNASVFRNQTVDITIPRTVTDDATTSGGDPTVYTVVGMAESAFINTAITSIRIEAPIPQVPDHAFSECYNLKSVELPTSVIRIGERAFYCYEFSNKTPALETVIGIENVTAIGERAFSYSTSLRNIDIPKGLTALGMRAFSHCTSLEEVALPASLTELDEYAFEYCSGLKTLIFEPGFKSVGSYAFEYCESLTDITLADGMYIKSSAFSYCPNINVLELKKGMTVESSAFNLSGIRSIVWPEEAITIEEYAFCNVNNLPKLTIPGWMMSVPDHLFHNCVDLTELELSEGVAEIGMQSFGCDTYRSPKLQKVYFAPGADNTLRDIRKQAFYYSRQLAEFPFQENQNIEEEAFAATAFTTITLYKGMTIGDRALSSTAITSIEWPEEAMPASALGFQIFGTTSMTSISFPQWMTEIPAGICKGWEQLTEPTLHEGVTHIGEEAFYDCLRLKKITFPSTLEGIGKKAFSFNPNYVNKSVVKGIPTFILEIPSSLRTIGDDAFAYRSNINIRRYNSYWPEGVESIGTAAFLECTGLSSYHYLPSTLKSIGARAFEGCTNMTRIGLKLTQLTQIPTRAFYNNTQMAIWDWPANITSIGDEAFYDAYLGNVPPTTVTTIGDKAFYKTSSEKYHMANLNLSNVKSLGSEAFYGRSIKAITWPEGEIEVGDKAFAKVQTLPKATFPDCMKVTPKGMYENAAAISEVDFNNVETISANTFSDCTYLVRTTVKQAETTDDSQSGTSAAATDTHVMRIPSTVKRVEGYAFNSTGTYSDRAYPYDLILPADVVLGDNAFYGANINEVSFDGCVELGQSTFANTPLKKLVLPDCIENIPDDCFNGMTSLTEVTMPDNIQYIGERAFYNCRSLTSIEFPESLREIKGSAFSGSGLTSITWPESEIALGGSVFYSTPVTSVTIPKWMDEVPGSIFRYCSKLSEITFEERDGKPLTIGESAFASTPIASLNLPDEVVKLSNSSFSGCSNITELQLPKAITEIPFQCFNGLRNLERVNLENIISYGEGAFGNCNALGNITLNDAVTDVPKECFQGCYALTDLHLSSSLKSIGNSAFEDCRNLISLELPQGLETIGEYAFRGHKKFARLEIPSSIKEVGSSAFANTSTHYIYNTSEDILNALEDMKSWTDIPALTEIISHAADARFGGSCFAENYNLKHFTSDHLIRILPSGMFKGCISLEDVKFPQGTKFPIVNDEAFALCASLKEFPYEVVCRFGNRTFDCCVSLKQLTFPTAGDYPISPSDPDLNIFYGSYASNVVDDNGDYNSRDWFYWGEGRTSMWQYFANDCSNLQSITIPYTGRNFVLPEHYLNKAPLLGVSYCYVDNILPRNYRAPEFLEWNQRPKATIFEYDRNYDPTYYENYVDNVKSILMVKRGEKWKYLDAGYGKRFNIIEMKNPVPSLEGEIFSEYDAEAGVNHYKALLRWEVELSDLNEAGSTEAEVWRDGVKVADVVFGQQEIKPGSELNLDAENVIVVPVTVNGELTASFKGDFDYPIDIKDDNYGNTRTLWVMEYNTQDQSAMYFDAATGARLNAFERYGYRSLFTLVHEFDSPRFDKMKYTDHYTYQVKLKGYQYDEYVNNDNFEPDADGNYYHKVTRSLPAVMESPECVIYPAVANFALEMDGLYSRQEVLADRDRSLKPMAADPADRNMRLRADLEPNIAGQQVYVLAQNKTYDVFKSMRTFKVVDTEDNAAVPVALSETDDVKEIIPEIGERYQSVIETFNRGTFGTPIVAVPDMPTLTSAIWVLPHEHARQESHSSMAAYGRMYLSPNVRPLGYDKAMPDEGDYFIGMWRYLTFDDAVETFAFTDEEVGNDPGELIYHAEGRPDAVNHTPLCPVCSSGAAYSVNQSMITHTDIFEYDPSRRYDVSYNARLYVKVPEKYSPEKETWVAVDTDQYTNGDIVSGVENVSVGNDADQESEAVYYDLQGRRIQSPAAGNTYIRVTSSGSSKVRIM